MTTKTEEQQKAEKAAADKASYTALAKFHEKEAEHYRKKADACDPNFDLVSPGSPGSFGGL